MEAGQTEGVDGEESGDNIKKREGEMMCIYVDMGCEEECEAEVMWKRSS
jgi:hypothetical protein